MVNKSQICTEENWVYLYQTSRLLNYYPLNPEETTWLVNPEGKIVLYVNCSDLFMWGCADAEPVEMKDIPLLETSLKDAENASLPEYAGWLYCARKRNIQPMGARYKKHPNMKPLFENLAENWGGYYGDGTGENIEKPDGWDTRENPHLALNKPFDDTVDKPVNWEKTLENLTEFIKFTRKTDNLYDQLVWSVNKNNIELHLDFSEDFQDKTLVKIDDSSLKEIEDWYVKSEQKYKNPYENFGHVDKYYDTAILLWAAEKTGKIFNDETATYLNGLLKSQNKNA